MVTGWRTLPHLTRGAVAADLRLAVGHLSRRLRQEAGSSLSLSLTSALATLETHGPLSPSELAAKERLARPGVTRIIARLQQEGLVTSERDAEDRRSYRVAATPEGVALLHAVRGRSRAFLTHALRRFDARELAVLAEAADLIERLLVDDE
jgi:DNA-binding MarR family transcriptional regulator